MKKYHPLIIALVIVFSSIAGGLSLLYVRAATGQLYLSPASKTITAGQTLSVSIIVNTNGDPVNVVQANLSYPTAIFDNVSIVSAPGFDIPAENYASNGVIRVGRGSVSPVTGTKTVATIQLHAKASGTATITFTNDSLVVRSTDSADILPSNFSAGHTYTISAPATGSVPPASKPAQTPTKPGSTSQGSTSTSNTATPKTGTSNKIGANASPHQSAAKPSTQPPSGAFNSNSSPDSSSTVIVDPRTLVIKLVDKNKQPLEGASVTLGNKTVKSDREGIATIAPVENGSYVITVKYNNKTTKHTVAVDPNSSVTSTNLELANNKQTSPAARLAIIIAAIVVLAVLVEAAILIERRHTRVLAVGAGAGGTLPITISPKLPAAAHKPVVPAPAKTVIQPVSNQSVRPDTEQASQEGKDQSTQNESQGFLNRRPMPHEPGTIIQPDVKKN